MAGTLIECSHESRDASFHTRRPPIREARYRDRGKGIYKNFNLLYYLYNLAAPLAYTRTRPPRAREV